MRPTREAAAGVQLRLTAAGFTVSALALGLGLAGLGTGNNAVLYVACSIVAALVVNAVYAFFNLKSVRVARRLPAEIVAERTVSGILVVEVQRSWLAARHLVLCEREQEPIAVQEVLLVRSPVPARWCWAGRGRFELGDVECRRTGPRARVGSSPMRRTRLRDRLPRATRKPSSTGGGQLGLGGPRESQGRRCRGLRGLRRFRDGDAQRRIHWPTSARVGRPMVVERAADDGRETCVRVRDVVGRAWEAELSAASGAVDEAMRRGLAVSLELPDQRILRARGAVGRRLLLETLAVQPFRDGGR